MSPNSIKYLAMNKSNITFALFLSFFLLIGTVGCKDDNKGGDQPIPSKITASVSELSLRVGEQATVNVTEGSGKYNTRTAAPGIASARVKGNDIIIRGESVGEVELTIGDALSGLTTAVKVNVSQRMMPLSLDQKQVSMYIHLQTLVKIVSGSGKYEVSVADPKILKAEIQDNSLILNSLEVGETTVTVTDTDTKKKAELSVKVTLPAIKLNTGSITLDRDTQQAVLILAGNGEYTIDNKSDKFTVELSADKRMLTVTGKVAGIGEFKIIDKRSGTEATVKVKVNYSPLTSDMDYVVLTLGKDPVEVTINGGSGKLSISPREPNRTEATFKDGKLTVKALEVGRNTLLLKDDEAEQSLTLTVYTIDPSKSINMGGDRNVSGFYATIAIPDYNDEHTYICIVEDKNVGDTWGIEVQKTFSISRRKGGTTKVTLVDVTTGASGTFNITFR